MASETNPSYQVKTYRGQFHHIVEVPGSKSITNRAMLLAALASGESKINNILLSDDSRVFLNGIDELGYRIELNESEQYVKVHGLGNKAPEQSEIYVGSAGTAARFLTALLSLSGGTFTVTSSEQMKRRPMEPLLKALEEIGTNYHYLEKPYAFPFEILGCKEKRKKEAVVNIDQSSQFLSALLMTAVLNEEGLCIKLDGSRKAKSYVGITIKMMEQFGCQVKVMNDSVYLVEKGQHYHSMEYEIEPDVSAACYFYAMAAVLGGKCIVKNVFFDSMQGDIRFLKVLEKMGCKLQETNKGVELTGPKKGMLKGIDVDLSDCSDQTMTLAAIAPFASGPTMIRNIGHIRGQESDRIKAVATELSRVGIECMEGEEFIKINPGKVKPGKIQTYDDHRMAMAFSILGMAAEGIEIENPYCCRKTFENYFDILDSLYNETI